MIRITNLKKKFDHRGIAGLHGVSIEVNNGEVIAILGPNGSGKTTLLNLVSKKLVADSGSVEVGGEISFFPSGAAIDKINVQKYLVSSIHLDIDDEKKIQLTRDLADTFEFTFQLRQNLNELSSGQLQKVLLARELINRPALLLMDEPFTHLDPVSRREILHSLFKHLRQQEISVIWVTHDLQEAFRFSDKVGILQFGKFEQIASPEALIKSPSNLFVAQFIGYRNFFPVKKEGDVWNSPWGPIRLKNDTYKDGLLVVPDVAWKLDPSQGISFKITERFAGLQFTVYHLQKEQNTISWIRSPQEPLIDHGTQVQLSPVLSECFLIPL